MDINTLWISFLNLPPWLYGMAAAFLLCWLVQLWFVLFRFSKVSFYKAPSAPVPSDGSEVAISVIICCRNQLTQLRILLTALAGQNYPKFEVIVVDDQSTDETYDELLAESRSPQSSFKLVRINHTPEHINSKKYALTIGIKAAKYPYLLLTDADCEPQSPEWIRSMATPFRQGSDLVLGYSPYRRLSGFLNLLVRFDAFYTALQYFSFALSGRPYMGVGRNLAYKKEFFFKNKGFAQHRSITGGDDDLFVNRLSGLANIHVALSPESIVYSDPKETFYTWFRQKLRHLSVGKHYKNSDKAVLGLLIITHIGFYAGFILLLFFPPLTFLALIAFLIRFVLHTILVSKAAKRLREQISWTAIPLLDAWLPIYYLIFGIPAVLSQKIEWK